MTRGRGMGRPSGMIAKGAPHPPGLVGRPLNQTFNTLSTATVDKVAAEPPQVAQLRAADGNYFLAGRS